jgi:hypothetical protein
MVRRKVEGNEDQRRAAARQARREGEAPSAQQETTGASKQRSHRPRHESHEEKVAALRQGKQDWPRDTEAGTTQQAADYEQGKRFADHEDYTDEHARVFSTLTDAQQAHDGEAVYLDEVARRSGLPTELTRELLHDLAAVHRLVTILPGTDNQDLGPRFEVKPRL